MMHSVGKKAVFHAFQPATHIVRGENNLSDLWIAGSEFNLQNEMQNILILMQNRWNKKGKLKNRTPHVGEGMRQKRFYCTPAPKHSIHLRMKKRTFLAIQSPRIGNRLSITCAQYAWNTCKRIWHLNQSMIYDVRYVICQGLLQASVAQVISEYRCHSNAFCTFISAIMPTATGFNCFTHSLALARSMRTECAGNCPLFSWHSYVLRQVADVKMHANCKSIWVTAYGVRCLSFRNHSPLVRQYRHRCRRSKLASF